MAGRKRASVERKKDLYIKGWRVEGRDYPIVLWYTSS